MTFNPTAYLVRLTIVVAMQVAAALSYIRGHRLTLDGILFEVLVCLLVVVLMAAVNEMAFQIIDRRLGRTRLPRKRVR